MQSGHISCETFWVVMKYSLVSIVALWRHWKLQTVGILSSDHEIESDVVVMFVKKFLRSCGVEKSSRPGHQIPARFGKRTIPLDTSPIKVKSFTTSRLNWRIHCLWLQIRSYILGETRYK